MTAQDPYGTFVKLRQPSDSSSSETVNKIGYLIINMGNIECSQTFYEMLGLEVQTNFQSSDGGALSEAMCLGLKKLG